MFLYSLILATKKTHNVACHWDNFAWIFSSGRGSNPILARLMSLTLALDVRPSGRPAAVEVRRLVG